MQSLARSAGPARQSRRNASPCDTAERISESLDLLFSPKLDELVAALDALSARTVVGHYAQRLAKLLGWRIRATEEGQGRLRLEAAAVTPA